MMYNHEFLKYIAEKSLVKRVYLSTGCATMNEVSEALADLVIKRKLLGGLDIVLMHCVSLYPTPYKFANLRAIEIMRHHFGQQFKVGYSDHTVGFRAVIEAVMLGACCVEKHFTIDRKFKDGTDHWISADIPMLQKISQMIPEVEKLAGSGKKSPNEEELAIKEFMKNRFVV